VFLPMFFLSGVPRYLFVPLAEAVVFAMIASYLLSRTLVPTLALYLLKPPAHAEKAARGILWFCSSADFEHGFERLRGGYRALLEALVRWRLIFIPCFLGLCLSGGLLIPWLGQDFFPATDNGQFMLHVRAKTGTRIEETARLCDLVENSIRSVVPANELDNILDNIGLPYSSINYLHGSSGVLGASEADVLVSLREKHHPTADYVEPCGISCPRSFPALPSIFCRRTWSPKF
jgi:multidrug efflux pump subunit AcrB